MACNKTSDWWGILQGDNPRKPKISSKGKKSFVARVLEAGGDFWSSVKVCDY